VIVKHHAHMTNPSESTSASPFPPATTAPRAGAVARVFAFVGAAIVLVVGTVFSVGAALAAPVAMAIAAWLWRRRGKRLPAIGHWVAAMCGVIAAVVVYAGLVSALVPSGTWKQIQHAADSAQTASARTPPPAWLDRIAPGMAQQEAASRATGSDRAKSMAMAFGLGVTAIMFGLFFGTIGWVAGMLFGLSANGRWPGAVG
jgi:hypothetical protein